LFRAVRGRGPGPDQERSTRDLNQPCRSFISATKEESHGEEKEQEEEQIEVLNYGRAPRASVFTFRIRGVLDPAKRLNGVRPLLFFQQRCSDQQYRDSLPSAKT
jgi:hypothetical protein